MTEYFVFHREWNELRKTLSKNAWYELETLMLQLRWEGIDTDPLTITNKVVRSNWINIRARILNSMKNLKNKKNSKTKQKDLTPSEELENSANKTINPQDNTNIPQEEESVSNGFKIPINEEFENTIEEPQTTEESMGNYTGIQFKQEEEIEITEKNIYEIMMENTTNEEFKCYLDDNAKLADDFINKYKVAAYNPFLHLNIMKNLKSQGYPIDEEKYKILKQEWDNIWTEFQQDLGDIDIKEIKQKVVERYTPRYKKDIIKFNEMR